MAADALAVKQVASGYAHSLILTRKGAIFACGHNKFGQLGVGELPRPPTHMQIAAGADRDADAAAGARGADGAGSVPPRVRERAAAAAAARFGRAAWASTSRGGRTVAGARGALARPSPAAALGAFRFAMGSPCARMRAGENLSNPE